jgi:hypothetical protein
MQSAQVYDTLQVKQMADRQPWFTTGPSDLMFKARW